MRRSRSGRPPAARLGDPTDGYAASDGRDDLLRYVSGGFPAGGEAKESDGVHAGWGGQRPVACRRSNAGHCIPARGTGCIGVSKGRFNTDTHICTVRFRRPRQLSAGSEALSILICVHLCLKILTTTQKHEFPTNRAAAHHITCCSQGSLRGISLSSHHARTAASADCSSNRYHFSSKPRDSRKSLNRRQAPRRRKKSRTVSHS
jgi:hypothetical protein